MTAAGGLGNKGSNGGAISSIGVSWTIINCLFSYNEAVGNGGNPAKSGTVGGGSGGAIYNDGNRMTLTLLGTRIEYNKVNAYGSGIFFVTNDHTGNIVMDNTVVKNNIGGSWYPILPDISMHSNTRITVTNSEISGTVSPTSLVVLFNNQNISLQAFNINGNYYFKLRDIAQLLNDTNKRFSVSWNADTRTIEMTAGTRYTTVGGELAISAQQSPQIYNHAQPNILLDGKQIELTAYNISNCNYFKLRDIAVVIDFGVIWEAQTRSIHINTDSGYIE